jgi:hypothetical protein
MSDYTIYAAIFVVDKEKEPDVSITDSLPVTVKWGEDEKYYKIKAGKFDDFQDLRDFVSQLECDTGMKLLEKFKDEGPTGRFNSIIEV